MKEILLTSSALIAALLILRRLFRKTIPRRVQYALWGLVVLRLLVPVSLPAADFSLLTAAEPLSGRFEALYVVPERQTVRGRDGAEVYGPPEVPFMAVGPSAEDNTYRTSGRDSAGTPVESEVEYRQQIHLPAVLRNVWYGGMAVMACWLVGSNLSFWRKLRRKRRYFPVEGSQYPTFLVEEGLPSPCLFGLLRPAIYLTPAAVKNPGSLRHVLAHEETHARHLDPLWSLLRGVCLTVYWFDPLVWWAALASRADCELACDEGALWRLGEGERIPYGQTLLSLIPVAKGPGNPLLSATTMTAGKRQLKERITRIAENRKTLGTALFAVAAIAALVCAVTFTGAKEAGPKELTEAELAWFNEEFFNGPHYNIRNQFLSSDYEKPEDIDLFSLFYCGTSQSEPVTPEEREAAALEGIGFDPEVDLTKCSAAEMDRILTIYTGLTLAETGGVNLTAFTYLEDYDAYYYFHGDTNYRSEVMILSGEREGDLVRLHYADDFFADGWKCVTLRETGKGSYQFVSNLPWNPPVEYPAAELMISLEGLEPYEPQPVELLEIPHRELEMMSVMDWEHIQRILDPYCLMFFSSGARELSSPDKMMVFNEKRVIYAGVQHMALSSWPQPFLRITDGSVSASYFQNVLGRDGFTISYNRDGIPVTDYYFLTEDGDPVLLARCGRDVRELDLDGDGEVELVSVRNGSAQIVFQRDGKLYDLMDIKALLEARWPGATDITFGVWDPVGRCIPVTARSAYAELDSTAKHLDGVDVMLHRTLYFDGENLLLCSDAARPEDHIMGRYDAPAGVVKAAQEMVGGLCEESASYDDWRIGTLLGPFAETVHGQDYEIWQLDYELHAVVPVPAAGSAYVDENGWRGNYRPSYMVFRTDSGSERTYLYAIHESDVGPASPFFRANMFEQLLSVGELTYDELDGEELYEIFRNRPDQLMESLGALAADRRDSALAKLAERLTSEESAWNAARNLMAEARLTRGGPEAWERLQEMVKVIPTAATEVQAALEEIMAGKKVAMVWTNANGSAGNRNYATDPAAGNGPNREKYFTANYDWNYIEQEDLSQSLSQSSALRISSEDGETYFTFFPRSALVCLFRGDERKWFRATPSAGEASVESIFDFMRYWYDEVEWSALTENIVIFDEGQSRQEIAEAWAEAYTQTALQVTTGSKYSCRYVRTKVRVSPDGEIPETAFPEYTEGKNRFHFSYEEIFVLGNNYPNTLSWNWAGNTGEYEGSGAPEGALSRYRTGFLYRTEKGWRCDGVGTGP